MIYKGNDLYAHPDVYDSTFVGIYQDEPMFYSEYVKKAKNVLYLGSGSGRLLKQFMNVNPKVTGVELMPQMVELSRKLIPEAKVICTDILALALEEKFDLIIAPYRFICHFDKEQVAQLFRVIKKHLAIDGLFVGDLFSPYLPHDHSIEWEFSGIDILGDEVEKVYNHYLWDKQICEEYVEKNNVKTSQYDLVVMSWHFFLPEELEKYATDSSLKVKEFFGTYKKDPFTQESNELIFVINN